MKDYIDIVFDNFINEDNYAGGYNNDRFENPEFFKAILAGPDGLNNFNYAIDKLLNNEDIHNSELAYSFINFMEALNNEVSDSDKIKIYSHFLSNPRIQRGDILSEKQLRDFQLAETPQEKSRIKNSIINAKTIIASISGNIKDKLSFSDFEDAMPIYKYCLEHKISLSYLFSDRGISQVSSTKNVLFEKEYSKIFEHILNKEKLAEFQEKRDSFIDIDKDFANKRDILDCNISSVILDYIEYGVITDEVYESVTNIIKKYKKEITVDEVKKKVASNSNMKKFLEDISAYSSAENVNSDYLEIFELYFKKARFQRWPESDFLEIADKNFLKKFDYKIWYKFADLPMFKDSPTFLQKFIIVNGLFENDKQVEQRRQYAYNLVKDIEDNCFFDKSKYDYSSFERLNTLLYGDYVIDCHKPDGEINDLVLKDDYSIRKKACPQDIIKYEEYRKYYEREDFKRYYSKKLFTTKYIKNFKLRENVFIPEEIESVFMNRDSISESYLKEFRKKSGSFNKKVTDFLSPYIEKDDKYILKRNISIPAELSYVAKDEMTKEEFDHLCSENSVFLAFVNPVEEESIEQGALRDDLTKEEKEIFLSYKGVNNSFLIQKQKLSNIVYSINNFNFDENFFEFLKDNMTFLLEDNNYSYSIGKIEENFNNAKQYYKERGNADPTIMDIAKFLEQVSYTYDFGYKEFAEEVKNAGVEQNETYKKYEEIYKRMEERKKTTLPRHNKVYTYVDKNGQEYRVCSKILKLDDPLNLLAGERNFTNCCQIYKHAGESCMKHAALENNGGIFATYLMGKDGHLEMLTQSWIWSNESKLCLDNVEGTSLVTTATGKRSDFYNDIIAFTLKKSAEDIIKDSEKSVENYIRIEKEKLEYEDLTEEEKVARIKELEEIKKRQVVKIVTMGAGFNDFDEGKYFEADLVNRGSGAPKNYYGYTDANTQYVISRSEKEILPEDDMYEEVPIYRDERKVGEVNSIKITDSMLKKIVDLEYESLHKNHFRKQRYFDDRLDADEFSKIFACKKEDFKLAFGEDWALMYSENDATIKIYDMLRGMARIDDEKYYQGQEISNKLLEILKHSITLGKDKKVSIKNIELKLDDKSLYDILKNQQEEGYIEIISERGNLDSWEGCQFKIKPSQFVIDKIITKMEEKNSEEIEC